jgi:hypothetical protein
MRCGMPCGFQLCSARRVPPCEGACRERWLVSRRSNDG